MELTAVQRSIVEAPLGAAIVTAGAGSGKTRVLTHRIAWLLQNGISDTSILALTFTNKAADEMKRRIEAIIGNQCNVYLGTFHAWCARFLRVNIGKPFDSNFTIYDAKDSAKVRKIVGEDNVGDYKAYLEASNALDFDDLLEKTHEILASRRDVREKLHTALRYILVDEFQDTNKIQYEIIKILAGQHKNVMVVGDEDQCIYSWRGANAENLNAFLRDFPNASIYKLEENFRSSKNIVALANQLVSNNTARLDKVLFSNLPEGNVQLNQYFDERHEARTVAMQIASEHHNKGKAYSDFAILMRLNATSRNFEEQFNAFGIPHIIWGGYKFYERAEVKSTINYLRILINPRDETALVDILNYPKRGIGDGTIQKLREHGVGTLLDAVYNPPKLPAKATAGLKEFVSTFENLKHIYESFSLHDLAASLIPTIGLDRMFATGKEEDTARLENVYQLEQAIKEYSKEHPGVTLTQFLQTVSLVQDADGEAQNDKVVISTVHSAKGLEFENVFVIGLEDGIFPLRRAKQSASEIEEERRLLYVAITRARKNLYLSYCTSRFYQGSRLYMRPSAFLMDCGLLDEDAHI
ncbi:MAG: ATP-dependent helicase [Christensenellaceae bacterium]|jgi:DNA helicase-2/ATP-dependent DNA helicase PcrA|nr:ATP-dependent helicase [Christensenellaceae bacterium]